MIEIVVNGENKRVDSGTSVAEFLNQLGLLSPAVAVELNLHITPRETHQQTILKQGDVVFWLKRDLYVSHLWVALDFCSADDEV